MDWISVKDRLPRINDPKNGENPSSFSVLMSDGKNIQVGKRWICGNREYFLPDYREGFEEVSHWMTLPNPPKDK